MNPDPPKFLVESGLHPLCKALRMLGFDSLYRGNLSLSAALQSAIEERRIWIAPSENVLGLQYGVSYFILQSDELADQVAELNAQYSLPSHANPLGICLKCNCRVQARQREEIANEVPPRVFQTFPHFYSCPLCKRIYWPGSHYQRMKQKLISWGYEIG